MTEFYGVKRILADLRAVWELFKLTDLASKRMKCCARFESQHSWVRWASEQQPDGMNFESGRRIS